MTKFKSMVSKFANETSSESSDNQKDKQNINSNDAKNDKKRSFKTEDNEDNEEMESTELADQTRKSLRLRDSSSSSSRATNSRTISADSIKTRPHQTRVVSKAVKKSEETVVQVKTKGRNPGYAPPSVYSHLNFVPDIIDYDLDVLFVGINPGVRSSERSHHFAGPTNHFWPCLSESGLLPPGVRLRPEDDKTLPALCNIGLSNLVDRPSRMGNELSEEECRAAAPVLTAKIKKYRPRFVCFVSKQAWEMYTGVGLGLQTAWVSWCDEPEDMGVIGTAYEDVVSHVIQKNLDDQGYRLASYFESGPSVTRLENRLAPEGVPSPFVKREKGVNGSQGIKAEGEEMKIKTEMDEEMPMKMDAEEDEKIKYEPMEDTKIKAEQLYTENVGGTAGPSRPIYRGGVRGSRMFVMPSTSGRVTQYRREDKLAYMKQLAELVRRDRQIRGVKAPWET
ncbi:hypothetical protein BG011_002024 [Mortierella polycephala]|uniref:Uracil-DNA glycosylase-like domain-containing protein n=1 Tax=Mortierella polycephala TaxID=41804 RepID=A0A9P6QGA4_9FUNG|nr:hypothetical protein BG011_002024 [Mortierella polycephala]